jgi:hypothetical protein
MVNVTSARPGPQEFCPRVSVSDDRAEALWLPINICWRAGGSGQTDKRAACSCGSARAQPSWETGRRLAALVEFFR